MRQSVRDAFLSFNEPVWIPLLNNGQYVFFEASGAGIYGLVVGGFETPRVTLD